MRQRMENRPPPSSRPRGRLRVLRAAGVLELAALAWELPRPWSFWPAWEALGRTCSMCCCAWGLWHRIALCRTIALVYCLAAIVLYLAVLGLALRPGPAALSRRRS